MAVDNPAREDRADTVDQSAQETERLRELHRLEILDSPWEVEFDRLARLAAFLLRAPIAAINFLDHDRVWFKATVVLESAQAPRDLSFVSHILGSKEPLIVRDILKDVRFKKHSLANRAVGHRFYVGVPVKSRHGVLIGTLCVFAVEPRDAVSREELDGLLQLSEEITDRLETRIAALQSQRLRELRDRLLEAVRDAQDRFIRQSDSESTLPTFLNQVLAVTAGAAICLVELETTGQATQSVCYTKPGMASAPSNEATTASTRVSELLKKTEAPIGALSLACALWDIPAENASQAEPVPVSNLIFVPCQVGDQVNGLLVMAGSPHAASLLMELMKMVALMVAGLLEGISARRQGRRRYLAERTETQSALQRSQNFAEHLIQSSADGIIAVDQNLCITVCNRAIEEKIGVVAREVLGASLVEFPEFAQLGLESKIRAALQREKTFAEIVRADPQSKEQRHYTARCSPILDSNGIVLGALTIFRDVTEKVRMEEELRAQKNFADNLIESSIDGIYAVDGNFRATVWNRAMEDRSGISKATIAGENLLEKSLLLDRGLAEKLRLAMNGQRIVAQVRQPGTEADGARSFVIAYNPIVDRNDRVMGVVGVSREVTEQVRLQEELQAQKEFYEYLIESSAEAIYAVDRQFRAIIWNRAMERRTGIAATEILGSNLLESPAWTEPESLRSLQAAMGGEQPTVNSSTTDPQTQELRHYTGHWSQIVNRRREVLGVLGMARDVTEEVRLQEALRAEKELSETMIRSSSDGIYALDTDYRVTVWNRAIESLTHVPAERAKGSHLLELLPDLAALGIWEHLSAAMSGRPNDSQVSSIDSETNELHHYFGRYSPMVNTAGRVLGIVGVVRDVTRQVNMQEELRAQKEFCDTIIRSSNDGIYAVDRNLHITVWNPAMAKLSRLRTVDVLGQGLEETNPVVKNLHVEERLLSVLQGENVRAEDSFSDPLSGKPVYTSASYSPLRNTLGEVIGAVAIVRETTVETITRMALVKQQEFSATLVRSSHDGIFAIDREFRLSVWNAAIEQMSGLTASEALGQSALDLHPVLYQSGESDRLRAALAGSHVTSNDQRFRLAGKSTRYYSTSYSPLRHPSGEIIGAIGIVRDITDRKRGEVELRRAKERAESASVAKSRFLANMSHEIRTPMNAVIAMSEILIESKLDAEQRSHLEIIRSGAQGLLSIINEILDFSKLDSGKLELEQAPFSPDQCIESALDLMAASAAVKSLELIYRRDFALPSTITGDITRLRQILINLLGNAIKFTQEGTVSLSVTAVQKNREQREIQFAVEDSGIGIAPEKIRHLFEPFQQADVSTTRRFGGTGLGLTISHKLVSQMGGRIRAESKLGEGSRFDFTIPLSPGDCLHSVDRSVASELVGKRILVLGASLAAQAVLRYYLEHWGLLATFLGAGTGGGSDQHAACDILIMEAEDVLGSAALRLVSDATPILVLQSIGAPTTRLRTELTSRGDRRLLFQTKPIKPKPLCSALLSLIASEWEPFSHEAFLPPSHNLARQRPFRILVVEDHPVNQRITLLLLGQLGYDADVANNGLEALSALRERAYHVVFMDMHMPEMDGLSASREIHAFFPPGQAPWIIALTANAMRSDREECRAAGMNDFVSKPIEAFDLRQALGRVPDRLLERSHESAALVAANVSPEKWSIPEALSSLLAEEPAIAHEMLDMFLIDMKERLERLASKVAQDDPSDLVNWLHTIKGSSRQIGALELADIAESFEQQVRQRPLVFPDRLLQRLASSFEEVDKAMRSISDPKGALVQEPTAVA